MVSEDDSVVAAVRRDLDAIRERDPELAMSGLAMSALALAAEMDDVRTTGTSFAALLAISEEEDDAEHCKTIARIALDKIRHERQVSPTARAACARALNETLGKLREVVPEAVGSDAVDELASARAARVAG